MLKYVEKIPSSAEDFVLTIKRNFLYKIDSDYDIEDKIISSLIEKCE
jgi:hypothetical protein